MSALRGGVDDFLPKPISSASLWRTLGRVVPEDRSGASLIDSAVLLAACDGDEIILQTIVLALQSSLPERVRAVETAFEARDLGHVSRAAHKLGGLVCSFSTVVGQAALELEERAGRGERDAELSPLVARLAALAPDLVRQVGQLSVERLRSMAPP